MSVVGRAVVAIVLAGGESRRFGSDKLAADLGGRAVLDHALDGLPADAVIAIVGPARGIDRDVTFLREDPPGGGPAAGLIAGLAWALESRAELILVLPGDAPGAGRAARLLLAALAEPAGNSTSAGSTSAVATSAGAASAGAASAVPRGDAEPTASSATGVVGADRAGRQQVLQLALHRSAARALIDAAGPDRGRGQSVRRLLATLTPAPRPVPLPEELTDDIDTIDQLRQFRGLPGV